MIVSANWRYLVLNSVKYLVVAAAAVQWPAADTAGQCTPVLQPAAACSRLANLEPVCSLQWPAGDHSDTGPVSRAINKILRKSVNDLADKRPDSYWTFAMFHRQLYCDLATTSSAGYLVGRGKNVSLNFNLTRIWIILNTTYKFQ